MPLPPPWTEEHTVTANGLRLHLYRTGGTKPPLVLAHGLSDNGLCWTPIARVLASDYDVIAYDARGHGLSDTPPSDYSLESQADDLIALLEVVGASQAWLLGHSLGAGTVAEAAARVRERVRGVILEDPPWMMPASDPSTQGEEALLWRGLAVGWQQRITESRERSHDDLIRLGRERDPLWSEEELFFWATAQQQVRPEVSQRFLFPRGRWQETVTAVRCPLLLVTGNPQRGAIVTPDVAARVLKLAPRASTTHLAEAGHCIRRDQPAAFITQVLDFLTGEQA